jgi:protocatechuate 3,4-dioxygenase alpha subunit
MSSDDRLVATGSQTVGPFFHFGLTHQPIGRMIDRFPAGGRAIQLRVTVSDGDGAPVGDAVIELWQAGVFGRLPTSADGSCVFQTIHPSSSGDAAAHINVCLFARGLLRHLHTRIYFEGDPTLQSDAALNLVPEERRATLIATRDGDQSDSWQFAIRLQGRDETVFFDA